MDNLPILVLNNIFAKLTFQDLLHIRSVNSKFDDLATTLLKLKLFKVSLRTTEQLTEFMSVHNNSFNRIPFKEFTLNPNIGTDSQFSEFCQQYANYITHLYINVLPNDLSYLLEFYSGSPLINGFFPAYYDTRALERITVILQHAQNIQVLILEPDRDKMFGYNRDTEVKGKNFEQYLIRTNIKIPSLLVFYCGPHYLWDIPWTQQLILNVPEIEYIARRIYPYSMDDNDEKVVYVKSGTGHNYGNTVTDYLRRYMLYVTEDGKLMSTANGSWIKQNSSGICPKYLKDVEFLRFERYCESTFDDVGIKSISNLSSCNFPRVTVIEFADLCFGDKVLHLEPSKFPALRCVVCSRNTSSSIFIALGDNVYETVEEFDFTSHNSRTAPSPWHKIFPNLRKLVAGTRGGVQFDSLSIEQHLIYLVPRFQKIDTLCIRFRGFVQKRNWNLLTGGDPNVLSLMRIKRLEYEYGLEDEFFEELLKSSSLGYINNVTSIYISSYMYNKRIGKEQMFRLLQKLNSKHDYVELKEGIEANFLRSCIQFYP